MQPIVQTDERLPALTAEQNQFVAFLKGVIHPLTIGKFDVELRKAVSHSLTD